MNLMDDTLADESGIPFLSSADDIPVHSTPIKGIKIPLPSTKNVMKQLMSKPGIYEDYTDSESLQSIRHSDLHPRVKGQHSVQKSQSQNVRLVEGGNFVRQSNDYKSSGKHTVKRVQDLSDIDNLRQKSRNSVDRVFQSERSRSPKLDRRSAVSDHGDVFKRPKDVPKRYMLAAEDEKSNFLGRTENCDTTLEQDNRSRHGSGRVTAENMNSYAFSSYENRSKYLSVEQKGPQSSEVTNSRPETKNQEHQYTLKERTVDDSTGIDHSSGPGSMKEENTKFSRETRDSGRERRRFSIGSPLQGGSSGASYNRTLSSSKQVRFVVT
ncbi:uncharacterized protein LOC128547587 [Mercenaria mercenaria]|uniref:uncharacterized protein LOC128547587 n=1 Tax=Mercenaria mercenaria TaxID=6596 RepID=UPI00234F79B2|nr:uncharacterized protein LOC128547587 [Mercenaria mercenaria]